jgi:hypothetical protein
VLLIILHVAKKVLLVVAELISNRIALLSGPENRGRRTVDNLSILDVKPPHLGKIALVRAIGREKLGDDSHGLERVDRVLVAPPVEVLNAHAIRVDIAAILVAHTIIAITATIVTTLNGI